MKKWLIDTLVYPLVGIAVVVGLWALASALTFNSATGRPNLPSPAQTWHVVEGPESNHYLTKPFAYRGEQDQGILSFTLISLVRVAKGYALAIFLGTPIGFLLGASEMFRKTFDLIIQVLRPVSPLAWLPLMALFFTGFRSNYDIDVNEWASVCTVAVCAMWPTVLNTAVGVRAIPQDYHNVAKVLNLNGPKKLFKILLPAALPYMFTGFRLSLGIAWLVIVAAEMLTGKTGIGGFLNNGGYQAGIQEFVIMCIIVIGVVGFLLDRIMNLVEKNVQLLPHLISVIRGAFANLRSENRSVPHAVS